MNIIRENQLALLTFTGTLLLTLIAEFVLNLTAEATFLTLSIGLIGTLSVAVLESSFEKNIQKAEDSLGCLMRRPSWSDRSTGRERCALRLERRERSGDRDPTARVEVRVGTQIPLRRDEGRQELPPLSGPSRTTVDPGHGLPPRRTQPTRCRTTG